MKTKTDYHIDTALRSVMERRAERIPALSDDFAQQVMSKMNARKESAKPKRLHLSFIIRHSSFPYWVGIAAALLIAFLLWPESHKEATTQPEVKPIVAKAGPQSVPQPIVKEKKEEVLAEVQPTPQPVRKQRKAVKKHRKAVIKPEAPAEPMFAKAESVPQPEEEAPVIPPEKQALADIFLAEEALQVAYELRAQQEAIRAYAASLTGEEPAKAIIAF